MVEKLTETNQKKVYRFVKERLDSQETAIIIEFPTQEVVETVQEKLYGRLSAGTGYYNIVEWDDEMVEIPEDAPRHDYVFQVEGDSMEPLFEDQEFIYGKKDVQIYNGGVYALEVNYEEAFVKKAYIEEGCIRLVSLNEKYKDIIVTSEDTLRVIARILV
jgi:phage repressor protein C with HTH and peptisase S24 domain